MKEKMGPVEFLLQDTDVDTTVEELVERIVLFAEQNAKDCLDMRSILQFMLSPLNISAEKFLRMDVHNGKVVPAYITKEMIYGGLADGTIHYVTAHKKKTLPGVHAEIDGHVYRIDNPFADGTTAYYLDNTTLAERANDISETLEKVAETDGLSGVSEYLHCYRAFGAEME